MSEALLKQMEPGGVMAGTGDYSLEQYAAGVEGFYDRVDDLLSPARREPALAHGHHRNGPRDPAGQPDHGDAGESLR